MFDKEVAVNKHGVNSNIHSKVLSDEEMINTGFRLFKGVWYYSKDIGCDITFNVTINNDNSDFKIDIIDEEYGQPYDYQALLNIYPEHDFALKVLNCVEEWMEELQNKGILYGHVKGEYI